LRPTIAQGFAPNDYWYGIDMKYLVHFAVAGVLALTAIPSIAQQGPDICRNDAKFREQDFTVGTWDVFAGDKKTAEVKMELILNDCVIKESWTTGRPTGDGIGLFNYSPLLKDWGYYWATNSGATTSFRGGLVKPGEMRYVTQRPLENGNVRLRHWTLYAMPDGTVRELSIGTEDGGKTWVTEYDLKWVRRK
jgi:hypothetical protein